MKSAYFSDYLFYNSTLKEHVWFLVEDGVIAGYSEELPDGYEKVIYPCSAIFPSFTSAYLPLTSPTDLNRAVENGIGAVHIDGVGLTLFEAAVKMGFRVSFSPIFRGNIEGYLEECEKLAALYKANPKVRIAASLPAKPNSEAIESFVKFAEKNGTLLCASDAPVLPVKTLFYTLPPYEDRPIIFVHRIKTFPRAYLELKLWQPPYIITLGGENPFLELKSLALIYKGVNFDSTIFSAQDVFIAASLNGALALGFQSGELRKGYPADFMVVDFNTPRMQPVYNPISHLAYAAQASDVKAVFSAGEKL
jgi:hypothetical protein